MGEKREVAGRENFLDHRVEIHRGIEIGGLDEQMVTLFADRHDPFLVQTFLKQRVEHMLGSEIQLDRALVGLLEFGEPLGQTLRSIGIILHYMGCQPQFLHPGLVIKVEDGQRLVERRDSVVDTGEYMGMPVGEAGQKTGPTEISYFFLEWPHRVLFI